MVISQILIKCSVKKLISTLSQALQTYITRFTIFSTIALTVHVKKNKIITIITVGISCTALFRDFYEIILPCFLFVISFLLNV